MTDESMPKTDPDCAPKTSMQSAPATSGTPPIKPDTTPSVVDQKPVEFGDKPSDASRTQDKGAAVSSSTPKSPNDPQRQPLQPSPLNPKAPTPEGQGRREQDKNMPAKAPDAKPQAPLVAGPNAV